MRRSTLILGVLLFFTVPPVSAQQALPNSFAGWNISSRAAVSASSFGIADTQAAEAAAREYGFVAGEQSAYTKGPDRLVAQVYRMKDPSGAYGIYSYLRTPDMARADLEEHSSISPQRALVLIGNLVLDVRGGNLQQLQTDLHPLVTVVSSRAETGALPTLWEHLPESGFVNGSDRYVLGPQTLNQLVPNELGSSLGFSKGAEAEVAQYRLGSSGDAQLLIVDFPTPQLADDSLAALRKRFNVNGAKPNAGLPELFAKRALTLLAVVSGASSQVAASGLLDQVHSGAVLTWNSPSFEATQPGILTIVVGTLVGTGVLCAFALVASLSFAGFRLIVKRALPGKVFDRSNEVQVLQLGLSSKPINAEDFYDTKDIIPKNVTVDKNLPDRTALRLFR
jgi:hypothetical protein